MGGCGVSGDRANAQSLEQGNHLLRPNGGSGESSCRSAAHLFRARGSRCRSLTCCHVSILAWPNLSPGTDGRLGGRCSAWPYRLAVFLIARADRICGRRMPSCGGWSGI